MLEKKQFRIAGELKCMANLSRAGVDEFSRLNQWK
jgi:hypothetical protein